jgi:hypothetical protein
MLNLFLSEHVFFCRLDDAFVFLDLKNDKYLRMDDPQADAFRRLIEKHVDSVGLAQSSVDETDILANLHEVIERGILTADQRNGKQIAATKTELPTLPLLQHDVTQLPRVTPRDILRFLVACAVTWTRLRFRPMHKIVAAVARRKRRRCASNQTNASQARGVVAVFTRLRMLFPADYLCTFDSFALIEFLARYGIFPDMVFGVRLHPWGAHCWVQGDQYVFNDDPDSTSDYTPIMVV